MSIRAARVPLLGYRFAGFTDAQSERVILEGGSVSERADQFEERDEEEQGSESGGQDRREGIERRNWESGTGTAGQGDERGDSGQGPG